MRRWFLRYEMELGLGLILAAFLGLMVAVALQDRETHRILEAQCTTDSDCVAKFGGDGY